MEGMKRILVIVVTYNGMRWLDRCLGSLRTSSVPVDAVVVDNCSSDGTQEYIVNNYPEVRLICTGENLGFGRANNIGFRMAMDEGYDYVYLLNQDAWIFPDTFSAMTAAMEDDRRLGVLSPMQMTASVDRPDPRFERWCPTDALVEFREVQNGMKDCGRVYTVPFVMAAHWMISMECLKTTGGFSPSFAHYGEDDNFLHRAQYHGFRCGILSSVGAVHDRELRPMTRQASMRLKCVASVVKVSNPLNCLPWRLVFQPMELLAISVRYAAPSVVREMFRMVGRYPQLIRNRRISKGLGAFL